MKSSFTFSLAYAEIPHFAPRLGKISLSRWDGTSLPEIKTPGFITATSRGIVQHLSIDNIEATKAIRWAHIPFESFLERIPPAPTLQSGSTPLHSFLSYTPSRHILSLSARDPYDDREMPPNGKDNISVYCIRGVRKITPTLWKSYALACKPDLVMALSDIPFTRPPHSQKRNMKSIERSAAWLADFLQPTNAQEHAPMNVLVNMAGGIDSRARRAFSDSLVEVLHGKELERISPLRTLDAGVCGYVFDLAPLRKSLEAARGLIDPVASVSLVSNDSSDSPGTHEPSEPPASIVDLCKASLDPLPRQKPRLANGIISPHEVLRLIRDVGIDLFDAHWAQHAADVGVALDFRFPVTSDRHTDNSSRAPTIRESGKFDLGHNLFNAAYANDHARLASAFLDAASFYSPSDLAGPSKALLCPCAACSPVPCSEPLVHSTVDVRPPTTDAYQPPFTRAYLHHLLQTHEMSSHTLLVMHNLAVLDAFFAGIRAVLDDQSGERTFAQEVDRFFATYDEQMYVLAEARRDCTKVDQERGKGRLSRDKSKRRDE